LFRHGDKGTGCVEKIDVKERDEGDPDFAVSVSGEVYVLRSEKLEASGRYDVLEESKVAVSKFGMGEVGNSGRSGPRDDGDEEDRPQKST
jgi:hypothetical protein